MYIYFFSCDTPCSYPIVAVAGLRRKSFLIMHPYEIRDHAHALFVWYHRKCMPMKARDRLAHFMNSKSSLRTYTLSTIAKPAKIKNEYLSLTKCKLVQLSVPRFCTFPCPPQERHLKGLIPHKQSRQQAVHISGYFSSLQRKRHNGCVRAHTFTFKYFRPALCWQYRNASLPFAFALFLLPFHKFGSLRT